MTREELVDGVADGRRDAIARAITMLERGGPAARTLERSLFQRATGSVRVVGLTGPPGAGKSTLVDQLVSELVERRRRVAVLAVDPSSPFTGGAVLGDRVRMREHPDDACVYFRSIASRGQLGGLAPVVRGAIRVLDVAGFEYALVETVGVGQSEVDIAAAADCAVVVAIPGAGDEVQLMKAGLLESGDVYAVNRADDDASGARRLARDLRHAFAHRGREHGESDVPIVVISARTGSGITDLLDAVEGVLMRRDADGSLAARRRDENQREILTLAIDEARRRVLDSEPERLGPLLDAVTTRERDPHSVALELLGLSEPEPSSAPRSPNGTDQERGLPTRQA